MPGEDDMPPVPAAAAEHIHAELERHFGQTTGDTQKFLRAIAEIAGAELDAAIEIIKAEVAEDKAEAARHGRRMNTETINYEALARDALIRRRGLRKVEGWSHPPAPNGWFIEDRGEINVFYRNPAMSLRVGLSCEVENDGRAWLHLSVSHRSRIPTWGELGKAKEAFLGDLEAYQVLPPRARYVNIDSRVLNLYAPLNGPVLPDFTRGTGGI